METIRGYHLKQRKGLSHWDAILEEWLLAIERFCRIMGGYDAPYFYNERANIGVLAGAAWRCGRVALEEFQYDKGYKNKPKWLGRADLWLASEGLEELIEAKFKWVSLRSRKSISQIAEDVLDKATTAAKESDGLKESDKTIGVAFFPLYTKKKDMNEIDKLIENALEEFFFINYHAIAWCFPKETRKYVSENDDILPGIVMIIKNART